VGILDKHSADLSAEDIKNIERPLGERVPYPMLGLGQTTDSKGGMVVARYLGTLERPLMVCSERSLDEVEGILIRDMPTPEMLPMFHEVMSALHPRNKRRAMFIKGAPGAGKTFLGDLAGRVATEKGAIKIDCTGLNLNELFYETVLDFKGGQRFYDALDGKIAQYNEHIKDKTIRDSVLNPMSVDILRDCLGGAFVEEADGQISIDWGSVKQSHTEAGDDGSERVFLSSRQSIEIAIAGLMQVSKKEGLDAAGGNALGMATQPGVAWQSYKEGRVLILDELNRAKPGTFGTLHGWLQFVIGETKEYTARNPLKEKGDKLAQSLRFTHDEMTAGHFVFMTGNTLDDSAEVQELPEALSSRIVPKDVPKATPQGWQHRFCQILTGLPISTIYEANRDAWDKNPVAFGDKLVEWRRQAEDREVPAEQIKLLHRWRDVLQATENLAKFLDAASKVVNPDSDWYRKTTSLAQLMEEIDDSFKKEVAVDFRKITYFLNAAYQDKPAVRKPAGGIDIAPFIEAEDMPETAEEIQDKIGSYLTYVMIDWIVSSSFDRGKDGLGRQLLQLAQDCALIRPTFNDAKNSNRKTIAELLDYDPLNSDQPDVQAEVVRSLLCDNLRQTYSDIKADDEELMSVQMVRHALDKQNNKDAEQNIVVFNGSAEKIYESPLLPAYIRDKAAGENASADELVSRNAFLYALAAPSLRQKSLSGLWSQSLHKEAEHDDDPGLAIAEARAEGGFGVTTVMVAADDNKSEALHVVWNRVSGALMVTGDADITPELRRVFKRTKAFYINRNDSDAPEKSARALEKVMGAEGEGIGSFLKTAFLMRAMLDKSQDEDKANLSSLLVSNDIKPYLPVYLTGAPSTPDAA